MNINVFSRLFSLALFALCLPTTSMAQFSFGPEVYYRDYSETAPQPFKSDEYGSLIGLYFGYDRTQADAIYFGADLRISGGKTVYDGGLSDSYTGEFSRYYQSTTDNIFVNVETRLGYNFDTANQTTITPFISYGAHVWGRMIDYEGLYGYDELYSWGYLGGGIKTHTILNNVWSIGLKVNLMQMKNASMDAHNAYFELGNKLQLEIEIPIQYKNIQLVPFYRSQDIGHSNLVATWRYDDYHWYYEPDSTTHVVGLRLALLF